MARLIIQGNGPLEGSVGISGAKNAALPCLAATILCPEPVTLTSVPRVKDIHTLIALLRELGLHAEIDGGQAHLEARHISRDTAPYELVKTMRASILVLGPLLARCGSAHVALPGGCAIGARPVDRHLDGLKKMGAEIELKHGIIHARTRGLRGADILFEKVTVTGTENLMMAATLARGTTTLRNAAREPEVVDLARLLRSMGANIQGEGTGEVIIQGVDSLHTAKHQVVPDRIETGTYVCAAAITSGSVRVSNCCPDHLRLFLEVMQKAGLPVQIREREIWVKPHQGLQSVDIITQPYPGFPTDMQAQLMAVMTQAHGRSMITEAIFENRFMHAHELMRMGANIRIKNQAAVVSGPTPLSGAPVHATDLRASASLVLAGLVAEEETVIHDIHHLDRGYDRLEEKLAGIGAIITRRS